MDDTDVINFLLSTEIIPLALRIMESGSELSKTVATFIVQKVLPSSILLSSPHLIAYRIGFFNPLPSLTHDRVSFSALNLILEPSSLS